MKGVSYLTDEEGRKTHVVLDLAVWQTTWQAFVEQAPKQTRKPGGLKEAFRAAGFDTGSVGDVLLEPMSEELALWYDNPVFPEASS